MAVVFGATAAPLVLHWHPTRPPACLCPTEQLTPAALVLARTKQPPPTGARVSTPRAWATREHISLAVSNSTTRAPRHRRSPSAPPPGRASTQHTLRPFHLRPLPCHFIDRNNISSHSNGLTPPRRVDEGVGGRFGPRTGWNSRRFVSQGRGCRQRGTASVEILCGGRSRLGGRLQGHGGLPEWC